MDSAPGTIIVLSRTDARGTVCTGDRSAREILMPFDAQKAFEELRTKAWKEVLAERDTYSARIKGFFNNQLRRRLAASASTGTRDSVGKAISLGIRHVPFVGPVISALADAAMDNARNRALSAEIADLQSRGADAMQAKGELLVYSIAQKYCDALRKYEDARRKADEALPPQGQHLKNCTEIAAYLKTVYYWRYRMARLRFYQEMVMAHCKAVGDHLEKEEHGFLASRPDCRPRGRPCSPTGGGTTPTARTYAIGPENSARRSARPRTLAKYASSLPARGSELSTHGIQGIRCRRQSHTDESACASQASVPAGTRPPRYPPPKS